MDIKRKYPKTEYADSLHMQGGCINEEVYNDYQEIKCILNF